MKKIMAIMAVVCLLGLSHTAAAEDKEKKHKSHYKKFTECAAIRMKEISLKKLSEGNEHTTKVPEGWTVVSGTGGEGHPKLLICR